MELLSRKKSVCRSKTRYSESMKTMEHQDELRWKLVKSKTPDSTFYYGVKSTGVYCRVGCKSRLPLRKNVCFFDDTASAQEAGFRACKRCEPGKAIGDVGLAEACLAMEQAGGPLRVGELAALAKLSDSQFHRAFKKEFGMSPHQYGRQVREQRLREALESGDNVTDAAYNAGYGSSGQFYSQAEVAIGMKPGEYRQGGVAQVVRYAVCRCRLGWLLVGTTQQGICAVELGDRAEELEERLAARFHQSRVRVEPEHFYPWLEEVLASLEAPRCLNHLPLDLKGTVFQRQVWQALRQIPPGQTRSYSEIAAKMGKPKAYRAVARACAQNSVALLVPCHRVVGADGSLTGYRWGLERKRSLLEAEEPGIGNS
jgi:AraC family transcriptional regulator of adaptative response/methylated-DNA-[protein]-cysteine methyltransferase